MTRIYGSLASHKGHGVELAGVGSQLVLQCLECGVVLMEIETKLVVVASPACRRCELVPIVESCGECEGGDERAVGE